MRGVKVIDDFGHHPTAIAQTLQALRHRYPRASALGGVRAALEHHPARGFQAAISGSVQIGRRRFHLAGRAAGADPRK